MSLKKFHRIRPNFFFLTKCWFGRHSTLFTYGSLQAKGFALEDRVFLTEPGLSHDLPSGSFDVVSTGLDRNSSSCYCATLFPIGPGAEGILLSSNVLHLLQNILENKCSYVHGTRSLRGPKTMRHNHSPKGTVL